MARWLAAVLALVVGAGALVPPAIAYRCLMSERVTASPCCADESAAEASIGDPCCERLQAPLGQVRAAPKNIDPQLAPPLVIAVTASFHAMPLGVVIPLARANERPPDPLRSPILRI